MRYSSLSAASELKFSLGRGMGGNVAVIPIKAHQNTIALYVGV